MEKINHHIFPMPRGKWAVRIEGRPRSRYVMQSRDEAIRAGRILAKRMKGNLMIHNHHGEIESECFANAEAA